MLATQGTTIAKHSAHDKLRRLIPYSGANTLGQSDLVQSEFGSFTPELGAENAKMLRPSIRAD
jgi:hypothetical protein